MISDIQSRSLNWTNALTSYYIKSRRFSTNLVGFGPVRVSHVEEPELDQICRTHGDFYNIDILVYSRLGVAKEIRNNS